MNTVAVNGDFGEPVLRRPYSRHLTLLYLYRLGIKPSSFQLEFELLHLHTHTHTHPHTHTHTHTPNAID